MTAKGDSVWATAANAGARLAVGNNGAILVADSAQSAGVRWSSTGKTAGGGQLLNVNIVTTLTASANGDALYNLRSAATIATGTASSLSVYAVAADGAGMDQTGTGAVATAYGVYTTAPTIGATNWGLYATGNSYLSDGKAFINDTSNANMTVGLTINQGANVSEGFALKNSNIDHGVTSDAETDTYYCIRPLSSGGVGAEVRSLNDLETSAYRVVGIGATQDTTKSTAAAAVIEFDATKASGTTRTVLAANGNLIAIQSNGTTRFIFDSDGDFHADAAVSASAYDAYDDALRFGHRGCLWSKSLL